jgi:hypothetical protein
MEAAQQFLKQRYAEAAQKQKPQHAGPAQRQRIEAEQDRRSAEVQRQQRMVRLYYATAPAAAAQEQP